MGNVVPKINPFLPPDPILLHQLCFLRPLQLLQAVEQTIRVLRNLPEPLRKRPLYHFRPASLTLPFLHLFVRQHRLVLGAPVHERLLLVRKPVLEHLQEEPLRPPVVLRLRRIECLLPVIHAAHALELPDHCCDVLLGGCVGMDARLDCVVLRGEPEGIEPHGREDVPAQHPLIPEVAVRRREVVPVPHVQPVAARVRKHHQAVVRFLGFLQVNGICAFLLPALAPLGFRFGGIVGFGHVEQGIDATILTESPARCIVILHYWPWGSP